MDTSSIVFPFHVFDQEADFSIVQRRLPHWSQAGAICFITWRTDDSLPKSVLDEWHNNRSKWLGDLGIDPTSKRWREDLQLLDSAKYQEFLSIFWNRWHDELDACHGACVLRQPELAKIVESSLHYFDNDRYLLLEFIVMPNHVHIMAAFPDEHAMLAQCESWKHFTATQINKRLKRRDRFWQKDAFDHLVRSERQFEYLRHYIADNPKKAGLKLGEYLHFSQNIST